MLRGTRVEIRATGLRARHDEHRIEKLPGDEEAGSSVTREAARVGCRSRDDRLVGNATARWRFQPAIEANRPADVRNLDEQRRAREALMTGAEKNHRKEKLRAADHLSRKRHVASDASFARAAS